MSEKALVERIRKYLTGAGAKVEKQHGTVYGRNGTPDLIGCYHGQAFAFEVKLPGKQLTPLQSKELLEWSRSGAVASRVESVDDVINIITRMKED